jgi:hypothetical protein
MRAVSDEMVLTLSAGCTEIIGNLGGFFQIPREWAQKERAQQNPVSEEPTPRLGLEQKVESFQRQNQLIKALKCVIFVEMTEYIGKFGSGWGTRIRT